jgi:DNA-binding LacI/PurR family transcriptional regulator
MADSPLLGKWHDAKVRILSEIEAGRWKAGEKLPPPAWLCQHLGLTTPTLRKAMGHLVEAGTLEPSVRGWRVAQPIDRPRGLKIAMIRHAAPDGNLAGEAEREMFFRRALEQEASRAGMRIESWGFSDEGTLFRDGGAFRQNLSGVVDGVILSTWRMERPELVFPRLSPSRLPVAIWDERPQGGKRPVLARSRWFTSGYTVQAGMMAARHLLELGHRRIAYLSPYHGSDWSMRRLEGLEKEGLGKAVRVEVEAFVHRDRWDPVQFEPSPEEVESCIPGLDERLGQLLSARSAVVAKAVAALLRDRAVLEDLDGMFVRALEDKSVTAWVAANDDIALLAWSWLTGRGVRVGQDLSLLGFDNTLRSQEWGLTSIGFAEERLATAMVDFLADSRRWNGGQSIQVNCSLVMRSSTSRPFLRE